MKTTPLLVAITVPFLASAPLQASEWTHEVAPYMWGTSLEGTTSIGAATMEVDASLGDILDALEMAAMGSYRGSNGRVSVMFDVVYAGLGGSGTGPAEAVSAHVDIDQLVIEGDIGYAFTDHLHGFVGLRYTDLQSRIRLRGPFEVQPTARGEADWVDPVIGLYYGAPISGRWSFSVRGDVGGFGVGSDFAWQGVGTVRWQSSPGFGVLLAYRYLSSDYDQGKDESYFRYDMSMHGPALGVVFTF